MVLCDKDWRFLITGDQFYLITIRNASTDPILTCLGIQDEWQRTVGECFSYESDDQSMAAQVFCNGYRNEETGEFASCEIQWPTEGFETKIVVNMNGQRNVFDVPDTWEVEKGSGVTQFYCGC